MYTVEISDYENFRQNIANGVILHESVKFSANFDEFLDECVVDDSHTLKSVHGSILRSIVYRLWREKTIVEKECFILCMGDGAFPMFIRAIEKETSVLIEFDDFKYDVNICCI